MDILAAAEKDLTVSEIAEALQVHRTICHRLVATLERRELVSRSSSGRYRLGAHLVRLARAIGGELRAVARPFLLALNKETDETVHLAILAQADTVFIDGFESSKALRVISRNGRSRPAHVSSMGKAMLAYLSKEELLALYPNPQLERVTARTLKSRSELFAELQVIRERGYATNMQESEDGLGSVAAAIIDQHGTARAAISIAAPINRFKSEIPRLIKATQRTAKEIGEHLG